jgi:hypothetical protein
MSIIDELYTLAEKIGKEVQAEKETSTDLGYSLDLGEYLPGAKQDLRFSVEYTILPPEDPKKGPILKEGVLVLMTQPFDSEPCHTCDYWRHDSLSSYLASLQYELEEHLEYLAECPDARKDDDVTKEDVEGLQKLIDLTR